MTLRKATREEFDEITIKGIFFLKLSIGTSTNGFIKWKNWINSHYDFGEENPDLSRIVKEVLEID